MDSRTGFRTGKDANLKTPRILACAVAASTLPLMLVLSLAIVHAPQSYAQTYARPQAQPQTTKIAALHEPAATPDVAPTRPAAAPDPVTVDIQKELAAMKARIELLEAELKSRSAAPDAPLMALTLSRAGEPAAMAVPAQGIVAQTSGDSAVASAKRKIAPFSDSDWTWLNGNPRNKDTAFDTKFFTPEIRADITYNYDLNKPIDNSEGGSSELFRANEIQLEQLGVGGDFHYDNVRARLMTQFGMYSSTTPRNDPSPAKGQWDLTNAYRYLAEAYGGYHIDALNGINIDAGIFMSYVGLFSYYNFDNWAYQPSYVSSNTPWFFEGVRIQIFPNPHLKIEPWIINGWQSYGSANSRKGLGGQIKWTPRPWVNSSPTITGWDTMICTYRTGGASIPTTALRSSISTTWTDSRQDGVSFTGDLGCEFGGGVSCHGNTTGGPKQSFVGYMIYHRIWFKKDTYALRSVAARSTIQGAT